MVIILEIQTVKKKPSVKGDFFLSFEVEKLMIRHMKKNNWCILHFSFQRDFSNPGDRETQIFNNFDKREVF